MKRKRTAVTHAVGAAARSEDEGREFGARREKRPLMLSLYRRAEQQLREHSAVAGKKLKSQKAMEDPRRMLHELQVHQVELEMQNEELRQSRIEMEAGLKKYSDLYDFAPIGYLTTNRAGKITEANRATTQLFGVGRTALLKKRFSEIVHAEDRPVFAAYHARLFESKVWQECELRLVVRGGNVIDVRLRAALSESGDACRVAVTDITARKRAENKLRVSEIRYRRLFETAYDGVLILDPTTRKITDANPFMTRLLGRPQAQLIGKELFEIGLLNDETASQEMFQQLKRTHQVRYPDLPLKSRTGRRREVEVVANLYQEDGHPVIQCNIRDITERKRAEKTERRMAVLGASHQKLEREIVCRRGVEAALRRSERRQRNLLEQSIQQREQLRQLSRYVLRAQEEERKSISRELHDVIAQTLAGINVRLGALKLEAALGTKGLDRSIAHTERMVEKSVKIVHQFARELRPAVLDDLGLIPALHSYMKEFNARTGVRVRLRAIRAVEQLDGAQRTVLFRVAQEALTNVARHAHASRVEVRIQKVPGGIGMSIRDDGRSFRVRSTLSTHGGKRLGLVGMRERVEMIGGKFTVVSSPGRGTSVHAEIPLGRVGSKRDPEPKMETSKKGDGMV